jgi:hypothetical protein
MKEVIVEAEVEEEMETLLIEIEDIKLKEIIISIVEMMEIKEEEVLEAIEEIEAIEAIGIDLDKIQIDLILKEIVENLIIMVEITDFLIKKIIKIQQKLINKKIFPMKFQKNQFLIQDLILVDHLRNQVNKNKLHLILLMCQSASLYHKIKR